MLTKSKFVFKNERYCKRYCGQHGMVSPVWLIRLRIRIWRIIIEDIGGIVEEHCECQATMHQTPYRSISTFPTALSINLLIVLCKNLHV
jgi:hypothetical protein